MKHGYSELKRGTRQACDWKVYAACVAKDICCFLSFLMKLIVMFLGKFEHIIDGIKY